MTTPTETHGLGIGRLTEDIDELLRRFTEPHAIAGRVGEALSRHLDQPGWLPPCFQEPDNDRYRQHLIHVSPCRRFSIVSLVWKPGQCTPIHDHVSWCVVGVYSGLESSTGYQLFEGANGRFLVPTHSHTLHPGATDILVPPDEDIHQVTCAGDDLTVSIHIYGADIGKLGNSVNRRFDDVEIRSPDRLPSSSRPLRWRTN